MEKKGIKNEKKFSDIGKRLKAIRESLNHTLDTMSVAANISRSYISEFERGMKLPNSKYLKYLFEAQNINLHYVFNGDGRMFNPPKNEQMLLYNFGKYEEEIKELLYYITNIPHALYDILGHFTEYKAENEAFLKKFMGQKDNKKNDEPND
jgi:transcriptional regulator with XRE-family HTH domain